MVGASSGIGRAVALQAGAAGARVACAARRAERVQEAAAEAGNGAVALVCDVRIAEHCESVVAQTVGVFGGLDALVFATAVDPLARLADCEQQLWHDVLSTNVIGASLVCRAAVPYLAAAGGKAVFVSASSVGRPLPGMGVYETSKAALEEMVRAWRGEHPEVGFSTVAVGQTLGTEVYASWDRELLGEFGGVWARRGYTHDNGPGAMSVNEAASTVVVALTSPVDLRYVLALPAPGSTMEVGE